MTTLNASLGTVPNDPSALFPSDHDQNRAVREGPRDGISGHEDLSGQNHKSCPSLEAQIRGSARRDERAMPERIVSEEQRRAGPEMGFPEGPGAFGLHLRRRSLTDPARVCSFAASWFATKSLRQTGTGFMIRST